MPLPICAILSSHITTDRALFVSYWERSLPRRSFGFFDCTFGIDKHYPSCSWIPKKIRRRKITLANSCPVKLTHSSLNLGLKTVYLLDNVGIMSRRAGPGQQKHVADTNPEVEIVRLLETYVPKAHRYSCAL
jgi:hypothetical protein